jgi:hypothetical protein
MYLLELLAEDLRQERLRDAETSRFMGLARQSEAPENPAVRRRVSGVVWSSILPWSRENGKRRLSLSRLARFGRTGSSEAPCDTCP